MTYQINSLSFEQNYHEYSLPLALTTVIYVFFNSGSLPPNKMEGSNPIATLKSIAWRALKPERRANQL